MIVTVGRRCISASLRRYPWSLLLGNSSFLFFFPTVEKRIFPGPNYCSYYKSLLSQWDDPSWDGEGPFIQSFTVHRNEAVYGWCQEQPLLCHCTEKTLRSLRIVPSSQSWHQTGINGKGQTSPLSQWRHKCIYLLGCQDPSILLM